MKRAGTAAARRTTSRAELLAALRRQYDCGPVRLTGDEDSLYERHLLGEHVPDRAREHLVAVAGPGRWVRTEQLRIVLERPHDR